MSDDDSLQENATALIPVPRNFAPLIAFKETHTVGNATTMRVAAALGVEWMPGPAQTLAWQLRRYDGDGSMLPPDFYYGWWETIAVPGPNQGTDAGLLGGFSEIALTNLSCAAQADLPHGVALRQHVFFPCGLRAGDANDQVLTAGQVARFQTIIRAVSWVESRHGTGAGHQPARDPAQCGNPGDVWWQELTGQTAAEDRFVGGPGAGNYNASQLPAAAQADPGFPDAAKLGHLQTLASGHDDAGFGPGTCFYWAVPILVHKTNTGEDIVNGKTYKCGDASRARLVAGAVAYNGGGDAQYENHINAALDLIGWPG